MSLRDYGFYLYWLSVTLAGIVLVPIGIIYLVSLVGVYFWILLFGTPIIAIGLLTWREHRKTGTVVKRRMPSN